MPCAGHPKWKKKLRALDKSVPPLSVPQPGPHPCGLALGRDEDMCKGVREATVICCQHAPGLVQVSPQLEEAKVWDEEKKGAMLVQGTSGVSLLMSPH